MSHASHIYTLELKDQNGSVLVEWDASIYSDGSGSLPTRERILASIYADIAEQQDISESERTLKQ